MDTAIPVLDSFLASLRNRPGIRPATALGQVIVATMRNLGMLPPLWDVFILRASVSKYRQNPAEAATVKKPTVNTADLMQVALHQNHPGVSPGESVLPIIRPSLRI